MHSSRIGRCFVHLPIVFCFIDFLLGNKIAQSPSTFLMKFRGKIIWRQAKYLCKLLCCDRFREMFLYIGDNGTHHGTCGYTIGDV